MPILLRDVEFTLGSNDYAAHVSEVSFAPSVSTVEWKGMGGGPVWSDSSVSTWTVTISMAQDWLPDALATYLAENEGEVVDALFRPSEGSAAFMTQVMLAPGAIGGAVDTVAVASVTLTCIGRPKRVLVPVEEPLAPFTWSGATWVRRTDAGGPQFNGQWSQDGSWVDGDGYLHLMVQRKNDVPIGTEIISTKAGWGYGTYRWVVGSDVSTLHRNIVLGLFTYGTNAPTQNEIDIEMSSWSYSPPNSWWSTYWRPGVGDEPANRSAAVDAWTTGDHPLTTHQFEWRPDRIIWSAWIGTDTSGTPWRTITIIDGQAYDIVNPVNGVRFTGTHVIPVPDDEKVLLNLWVYDEGPWAMRGTEATPGEVIIRSFQHTPLAA